jgi:hypothetical protein
MRKILLLVCFILITIFPIGCSGNADYKIAKACGHTYFDAIKNKDFDTAADCYSPVFFEKVSRADTIQALKGINAGLGDLQSYKSTGWQMRSYKGTGGSYTRCTLHYETIYSKGSAEEIIIVEKSEDGLEMNIIDFKINSIDLLKNIGSDM